jgi:integrase
LADARNLALILVGFAGGFRRSELVAITVADLEFVSAGMVIHVARSKTDQEGVARKVAIPWGSDETSCPIGALRQWLNLAGVTSGPVFRSVDHRNRGAKRGLHKDSVGFIIKRMARRAGINPKNIAGHSLRSGHITQGSINKVNERAIMRQTGHRTTKSLDRYVRVLGLFEDNSAAGLGI